MKTILAIDPGASGGLAWTDEDGIVHAMPMPEGMSAQIDKLRELACDGYDVVIENVGFHVQGNSAMASAKFARHVGHLEAVCYAFAMPVEYVNPKVWMAHIGVMPKNKIDRKNFIKQAMIAKYPHLSITLKTADALGILSWYLEAKKS